MGISSIDRATQNLVKWSARDEWEALQRDIRSDAGKRRAAAPVTRAVAREVMVRTPLFARILSQFWMFDAVVQARAPAPELRNTDDEAIVFCEVRFPLKGDEARVAAVLDGLEEFEREEDGVARWIWFAAGSPLHRAARHRGGTPVAESSENAIGTTSLGYAETRKGALVLSVNSRERAGRGRELLASHLGDLVGPALITHQTPERALEEQSGLAPDEPAIPSEEAVQVIHSYLDDHYRRTLDDPLPMLDGKSLREAAATRKGRTRVIDWLKHLENTEHRRAAQQGHRPYDTAWLWREPGDRGAALTREERAMLPRGTLPAGRRWGRLPAAVPDVRRRVREPGIAMAAAVHGVLCTLRTSPMASALAIRSGAAASTAPAPQADGRFVSRATMGQWTDDEVATDRAHCVQAVPARRPRRGARSERDA